MSIPTLVKVLDLPAHFPCSQCWIFTLRWQASWIRTRPPCWMTVNYLRSVLMFTLSFVCLVACDSGYKTKHFEWSRSLYKFCLLCMNRKSSSYLASDCDLQGLSKASKVTYSWTWPDDHSQKQTKSAPVTPNLTTIIIFGLILYTAEACIVSIHLCIMRASPYHLSCVFRSYSSVPTKFTTWHQLCIVLPELKITLFMAWQKRWPD